VRLATLPESENGVYNTFKTFSELSVGKTAAATAAVKVFRLWREAHFQKSNVSVNEADWSSLLAFFSS
jgi:hypothetical protein